MRASMQALVTKHMLIKLDKHGTMVIHGVRAHEAWPNLTHFDIWDET